MPWGGMLLFPEKIEYRGPPQVGLCEEISDGKTGTW